MGDNCNPLGCENCKGCTLSALELYYRGRLILNKYLSEEEQNYIFIGEKNPDTIINKSFHKNYIFLEENNLKVILKEENLKRSYKNNIKNYFIDELNPKDIIKPEELIKLGISELYGIDQGVPKKYEIYENIFHEVILK